MKKTFVKQPKLPREAYNVTYEFKEVMGEYRAQEVKRTKRRYCAKHPTSYWGDGYVNCVEGMRKREMCQSGL